MEGRGARSEQVAGGGDLRDWKGPLRARTSSCTNGSYRSGGRILLYCATFVIRAHVPTHVESLAWDSVIRGKDVTRNVSLEQYLYNSRNIYNFLAAFPEYFSHRVYCMYL